MKNDTIRTFAGGFRTNVDNNTNFPDQAASLPPDIGSCSEGCGTEIGQLGQFVRAIDQFDRRERLDLLELVVTQRAAVTDVQVAMNRSDLHDRFAKPAGCRVDPHTDGIRHATVTQAISISSPLTIPDWQRFDRDVDLSGVLRRPLLDDLIWPCSRLLPVVGLEIRPTL